MVTTDKLYNLEWRNWLLENFEEFLQSQTKLQIILRHTSLLKWKLSKQLQISNILNINNS